MSELAETVERVVREVLAKLGHTVVAGQVPVVEPRANGRVAGAERSDAPGPSDAGASPGSAPATQSTQSQEANDSLAINRRVVTLADLPKRLAGVRRVMVPPGTVVTPAVQDELQKRQIKLVVGEPAGATTGPAKVVLVVAAATYDPAPLARALEREGFAVESRRADCLIRATDQLASDLGSDSTMGLLVTASPAAGICLANRHAGVRAILGARADTVAGDAASVGANLLVVDPAAAGFFAIKQAAIRFLRGGPRRCPEVFRERLTGKG
jgi:hypothetical protein